MRVLINTLILSIALSFGTVSCADKYESFSSGDLEMTALARRYMVRSLRGVNLAS